MKATELQIGDILNLSETDKEIIPCKVVELRTGELLEIQPNDTACDIVGYDMVRPISLTSEILEKNGWEHAYEKNHLGELHKWHKEVRFQQFTVWKKKVRFELGNLGNHPFRFVHELQHALRLCGLDELADNFKV